MTFWIGRSLRVDMEFSEFGEEALAAATEKEITEGMKELRDSVEKSWKEKATSTLDASKDEYLQGLTVTVSGLEVQATIQGWLPVAIEQGVPRFDMKPGLLGTRSSRVIPIESDGPLRFITVRAQSTGWWHPGIQARAIGAQVEKEMPRMVSEAFKGRLSRMKV